MPKNGAVKDPAVIAVSQDRQSKIFFGNETKEGLLAICRTAMGIGGEVADLADKPGDAHQPARTRIDLWHAHGAQTFTRDDIFLSIAHMEAGVPEQILDGTDNATYAVARPANRPWPRDLNFSLHLLMPDHKAMGEQEIARIKERHLQPDWIEQHFLGSLFIRLLRNHLDNTRGHIEAGVVVRPDRPELLDL